MEHYDLTHSASQLHQTPDAVPHDVHAHARRKGVASCLLKTAATSWKVAVTADKHARALPVHTRGRAPDAAAAAGFHHQHLQHRRPPRAALREPQLQRVQVCAGRHDTGEIVQECCSGLQLPFQVLILFQGLDSSLLLLSMLPRSLPPSWRHTPSA